MVYETLDMSALPDYTVGGTIHIIVNNQVSAPPYTLPHPETGRGMLLAGACS